MAMTALLAGVEHLAGGGAQSLVIVGDGQLHPAQAPIRQRAQEGFPEGLRLRRPGGNAQHFAAAIGVDPTAIIAAVETIRPPSRTLRYVASIHRPAGRGPPPSARL